MSKIADAEANATSLDGLVNDNGLITTLRNGPKPSWQYLVDGWESQFTTLFADGEIQIDQIVTDLQAKGDAELSSLLIGITSQADLAIAGIQSDVSEKLEQVNVEADEAIESIQNDTASAIASAQNRTDAAVDQLTNDANELLDNIEQSALSRSKISTPVTLSQGQTEITIAGFNASLSAYYVKDLNSDAPRYRLFSGANEDYTFDNVTTDTITLNQTYDAGTKVYAVSLDPAGAGVLKAESQFTSTLDLKLSDVAEGTTATVPSLGNAKYLIKTGVTPLVGDIDFADSRIGVLQPSDDGSYNALWFGAKDDPTDTIIQDTSFFNAAERAGEDAFVSIPAGRYKLSAATPTATQWELSPNAEIIGLGGVSPTFATDTTYLTGTMIRKSRSAKDSVIYAGETDYALQKARTRGVEAAITGVSQVGKGGLFGGSLASKDSGANQSCIGVTGVVINDNTSVPRTAWAIYSEAILNDGASGNTFAHENAIVNKSATIQTNPNSQPGYGAGLTVGEWCSVGIGEADDKNATCWKATLSASATAKFSKGWVIYSDSIQAGANYSEAISLPQNYAFVWYPKKGATNQGEAMAWVKAFDSNQNGAGVLRFRVNDVNTSSSSEWSMNTSAFTPTVTNFVDLGLSNARIKSIYLQNSPDVVSDRDKKTEIRPITDDEINAGLELARNVKFFKWIDEVNKKGSENSYLHASVIAQEAYDILTNNNLDASKYGLVSSQSGNWSVLPTELNMLMSAALVAEQDKIKSRLDALEA